MTDRVGLDGSKSGKATRWLSAIALVFLAALALAAYLKNRPKPPLYILTSLPVMMAEDFTLDQGPLPLRDTLAAAYDLQPIAKANEGPAPATIPGGKPLLLALQPYPQSPEALVALDQWVRDGGRLLLVADPLLDWPSQLPLADPRRPEMRDILNQRIKKRESFRPFAPSILEEHIGDYFEQTDPAPTMLMVYRIKPQRRGEIPAVTHVDGSGRLQTVSRKLNQRYYQLISDFAELTGVPIVLNTSFNENEPVVCTPEQAIDCFLKTRMDVLYLGNYAVRRANR